MKNCFFALKLMWTACPSYIIFSIFLRTMDSIIRTLGTVWFIPKVISMVSQGESLKNVIIFIILYGFGVLVFDSISNWYYQFQVSKELIILHKNLKTKFYKKNLELNVAFFEASGSYENYLRASQQIDGGIRATVDMLCSILSNIISIVTIVGVLVTIDFWMLILIILFSTITLLFSFHTNQTDYDMTMSVTPIERKFRYIDKIFYDVKYSKEMRLTSIGNFSVKCFEEASDCMIKTQLKYRKKLTILGQLNCCVNDIFYYGVLVLGTLKYSASNLGVGMIVSFWNGITMIRSNILSLFSVALEVKRNSLFIDNLKRYLEIEPDLTYGELSVPNDLEISFQAVDFSYINSQKLALVNIDTNIKHNSITAIVGYNGAGKSTLSKLLLGLYRPTKGQLLLNGIAIQEYDIDDLHERIIAAPQDFQIYAYTVAENILMHECLTEYDTLKVWDALEKVGLKEKVLSLNNGIHTHITKEFGDEGCFLSGGEQQKIALARLIVKYENSQVIVLDEPTSALDPIAEKKLLDEFFKLFQDKTIIFISHNLSTVLKADRILFLDHGEIAEAGSHSELIAQKGKYYEMYMAQAEKYMTSETS